MVWLPPPLLQFAIVDEAYPYISKRLLTDESPRLKVTCQRGKHHAYNPLPPP